LISYEPLHKLLRERGLVISDFRGMLNSKTIVRINNNESVQLRTIEKLCKELKVPIERIVEIKFE